MAEKDFKSYDEANMGVSKADLDRGFIEAAPTGNYEGELDTEKTYRVNDKGDFEQVDKGTLHPGQIEPDGFQAKHGAMGDYGFVRVPMRKYDVERN